MLRETEVEWPDRRIFSLCLDKDLTRLYETANGLAMDLKRYLNQEPADGFG